MIQIDFEATDALKSKQRNPYVIVFWIVDFGSFTTK
jgi:hypothetical protein